MKSPRNPYSIATPETWELIRAAYLSGQSATVVATRFGTTAAAIRKRAGREGWTKLAYARAKAANGEGPQPPERDPNAESQGRVRPFGGGGSSAKAEGPPPAPREVLTCALHKAGRMLMEGRGAEAQAMARAAEGLMRLAELAAQEEQRVEAIPSPAQMIAESMARREEEWRRIEGLARQLLGDGNLPASHTPDAFRWRAERLGPEIAEADRARAGHGGWYGEVYDADGSVIPPEEARARQEQRLWQIMPRECRPAAFGGPPCAEP